MTKTNKPSKKKKVSFVEYMGTAIPISAAITLILAAAGFIAYKVISAYNYHERWKDYDECGLS